MKVYQSMEELIGHTPVLKLNHIMKKYDLKANLYAKMESFNATGSAKDRIAREMIDDAEQKGILKEGSVIIEPTSGNTGIGLAAVGVTRGSRVIIVMPSTFSVERQKLIKAYGAEIVLSDGTKGMAGAIEKAEELKKELGNAFIPAQFDNPANWQAHYRTTGPELYAELDGKIDCFIAGVGTGGTITGTGKYLKEKKPAVKIIAVEPASSPLLSGGKAGPHKIQGIGANFIPSVLDQEIYDDIYIVTDEEAIQTARDLARKEGIMCGISSGTNVAAALSLAKKLGEGKTVVTVLPDTAERYFSTPLFEE